MTIAIVTSALIGLLIKQHLFKNKNISSFFLAFGVLIGIQSFTTFLLFITNNLTSGTLLLSDFVWIGILMVIRDRNTDTAVQPHIVFTEQFSNNKRRGLVGVGILIITLISIIFFIYASRINAQGDWDAWAIWNMHAKFITAGKAAWISSFDPMLAWSHPDYPLLLPLTVARLWITTGNTKELSPILVATIFTYGTVLLLICSIWELKGYKDALIAALIVFSEIYLFNLGVKQYADIPLSFYYLCSLCVLFLPNNKKIQYFLSGAFAAMAAWTKNEGILFAATLSLTVVILELKQKSYSNIKNYLTGLAIFSLPLSLFKLLYAPNNDLFVEPLSISMSKITSIERWKTLIKYSFSHLSIFIMSNPGNWVLTALVLMKKSRLSKFLVVPTVTLAGYLFIYLITPHDLIWHINSSLQRLLMHLYPSVIFLIFMSKKNENLTVNN